MKRQKERSLLHLMFCLTEEERQGSGLWGTMIAVLAIVAIVVLYLASLPL